ncbi:hypothetical protein SNEBB_002740 [Seison nebaliae]|nr:hypothetical protein SNEBB_002740 [Seison nebaliae]
MHVFGERFNASSYLTILGKLLNGAIYIGCYNNSSEDYYFAIVSIIFFNDITSSIIPTITLYRKLKPWLLGNRTDYNNNYFMTQLCFLIFIQLGTIQWFVNFLIILPLTESQTIEEMENDQEQLDSQFRVSQF